MSVYQPPLTHNGGLNTVFNPTDFQSSNTNPYLPISGGTLTGSLNGTSATFSGPVNVSSIISQTGYSLPTTYSSLPTSSQIGGIVNATMLNPATTLTTNTLTSLGSIASLPAGVYEIVANIAVQATAATTVSAYTVSINTTNSAHDLTSAVSSFASQTMVNTNVSIIQVRKLLRITTASPVYILGTFTSNVSLQTNSNLTAIALRTA